MADTSGGAADIKGLQELIEKKGLDIDQLYNLAKLLGSVKTDGSNNKLEATDNDDKQSSKKLKIYKDKEFVFETRQDCFIYRDARTKAGNYYIRIYDALTKKEFSKSLRTSNRHQALVAAEVLYREKRDKLTRGVKMASITTEELIKLYLDQRTRQLSPTPHTGITKNSLDAIKTHLRYWQLYINSLRMQKKHIERIPPDIGKEFANWLLCQDKKYYKTTIKRERGTINHTIAAIKKMYRDIAIGDKYITMNEFPSFVYLKVPRDAAPKRDILSDEEYMNICRWMQYTYTREKGIIDKERVARIIFGKYFSIQYNTGMRNREQLGLRWRDIKQNPNSKDDEDCLIIIPTERSKTGRGRQISAPIGDKLEAIKREYRKLNISMNPDDFIFQNLSKTKRGRNIPYETPAMAKRLDKVLIGSGIKEKLIAEERHITLYSARHFYCTKRLEAGVDIFLLALNMGTSVNYIEKTYSHLTTSLMYQDISSGQGKRGRIESRELQV